MIMLIVDSCNCDDNKCNVIPYAPFVILAQSHIRSGMHVARAVYTSQVGHSIA